MDGYRGDGMMTVVIHSIVETNVPERGAGTGTREGRHGDRIGTEIGVGGIAGGVVYDVV